MNEIEVRVMTQQIQPPKAGLQKKKKIQPKPHGAQIELSNKGQTEGTDWAGGRREGGGDGDGAPKLRLLFNFCQSKEIIINYIILGYA